MIYYLMNDARPYVSETSLRVDMIPLGLASLYQKHNFEEMTRFLHMHHPNMKHVFIHYRTVYDGSFYGPCEHELIIPCVSNTTVAVIFKDPTYETINSLISRLKQADKKHSKMLYRLYTMLNYLRLPEESDVPVKWIMHMLGTIAESNKQKTSHIILYIVVGKNDAAKWNTLAKGLNVTLHSPFESMHVTLEASKNEEIRYQLNSKSLVIHPLLSE